MRTGWRHGVVGVDDADDENTQVFYKDENQRKLTNQRSKDFINTRRKDGKLSVSQFSSIISRYNLLYGLLSSLCI